MPVASVADARLPGNEHRGISMTTPTGWPRRIEVGNLGSVTNRQRDADLVAEAQVLQRKGRPQRLRLPGIRRSSSTPTPSEVEKSPLLHLTNTGRLPTSPAQFPWPARVCVAWNHFWRSLAQLCLRLLSVFARFYPARTPIPMFARPRSLLPY